MAITSSGAIRLDADILVELGQGNEDGGGLSDASRGIIDTINTANASADRPDGATPHAMSEFYSYDHSATSSPSGDYGNSATGNKLFYASSSSLNTYTETVSASDYAGQSVVGETGYVYFRMQSHVNGYTSDAQLVQVDFHGYAWSNVGVSSGTYGYGNWKTTRLTGNAAYNHSSTWYTVAAGTSAGRWNRDTGNTPSGGTGKDTGTNGCIYFEASGSNGNDKDVYLRSPLITFNTNTIRTKWYHYGANFANPSTVWMGIYIT